SRRALRLRHSGRVIQQHRYNHPVRIDAGAQDHRRSRAAAPKASRGPAGRRHYPLMTVASKPTGAATPAVRVLNLAGIDYSLRSFDHDPAARRYGSEAADKLGVSSDQV